MVMKLPDDAWLKREAGERAFARGVAYFRDGLVEVSLLSESVLVGEAHGTETYRLRLEGSDDDLRWHCDCPAADGGVFCKHLVAAVLTARDGDVAELQPARAGKRKRAASKQVDLHDFLRAQPSERLAEWLMALAEEDRNVDKRLRLYLAASEPGALKDALAKVLAAGGFLDYRRTMDYAQRLDVALDLLQKHLQRDPVECRELCEYALKRLFKIIERCDDSSGMLGGRMQEIAELHMQACQALPPGKTLAKALYSLQQNDDWELLPIRNYWAVLGAQGQAAYAKLVMDAFEQLPPPRRKDEFGEGFYVCGRAEALARCTGDFDLLQRVLRRDMSSEYDYVRVLESLREFGRGREALAFAESAVKRFPEGDRLRSALAECLVDAGLDDEALQQTWLLFEQHPSPPCWDALKRHAGKAWPAWRQRALALAAQIDGDMATLQVSLLTHTGDLDAAIALARGKPVLSHTLFDLANRVRGRNPYQAGSFYLRLAQQQAENLQAQSHYKQLVELLALASRLAPSAELPSLVAEVREKHARKPKLMAMLASAKL